MEGQGEGEETPTSILISTMRLSTSFKPTMHLHAPKLLKAPLNKIENNQKNNEQSIIKTQKWVIKMGSLPLLA